MAKSDEVNDLYLLAGEKDAAVDTAREARDTAQTAFDEAESDKLEAEDAASAASEALGTAESNLHNWIQAETEALEEEADNVQAEYGQCELREGQLTEVEIPAAQKNYDDAKAAYEDSESRLNEIDMDLEYMRQTESELESELAELQRAYDAAMDEFEREMVQDGIDYTEDELRNVRNLIGVADTEWEALRDVQSTLYDDWMNKEDALENLKAEQTAATQRMETLSMRLLEIKMIQQPMLDDIDDTPSESLRSNYLDDDTVMDATVYTLETGKATALVALMVAAADAADAVSQAESDLRDATSNYNDANEELTLREQGVKDAEDASQKAWADYNKALDEYRAMFHDYKVLEGSAKFVIGEDKSASFRIDAPYDYLDALYLEGSEEPVAPSNYDVTEGSTVITLHQDYLEGLGEGEYTFTTEYVNGYAGDMLLTISKALPKPVEEPQKEEPKQDEPKQEEQKQEEQKQEEQKPADNKTGEQKKDEQKPVENKAEQNNAGSGLDKNGRPITGDAGVLGFVMMFISSASAMGYCLAKKKED